MAKIKIWFKDGCLHFLLCEDEVATCNSMTLKMFNKILKQGKSIEITVKDGLNTKENN